MIVLGWKPLRIFKMHNLQIMGKLRLPLPWCKFESKMSTMQSYSPTNSAQWTMKLWANIAPRLQDCNHTFCRWLLKFTHRIRNVCVWNGFKNFYTKYLFLWVFGQIMTLIAVMFRWLPEVLNLMMIMSWLQVLGKDLFRAAQWTVTVPDMVPYLPDQTLSVAVSENNTFSA